MPQTIYLAFSVKSEDDAKLPLQEQPPSLYSLRWFFDHMASETGWSCTHFTVHPTFEALMAGAQKEASHERRDLEHR